MSRIRSREELEKLNKIKKPHDPELELERKALWERPEPEAEMEDFSR